MTRIEVLVLKFQIKHNIILKLKHLEYELKKSSVTYFSSSTIYSLHKCLADDLSGEVMVAPSKKLEDLIRLAEVCVELLKQNEEHYAEVRPLACC